MRTLTYWIRRGRVQARQEPAGLRRWIAWADAAEVARLRRHPPPPVDDQLRRRWHYQEEPPHAATP
jgi:hypothetical protein